VQFKSYHVSRKYSSIYEAFFKHFQITLDTKMQFKMSPELCQKPINKDKKTCLYHPIKRNYIQKDKKYVLPALIVALNTPEIFFSLSSHLLPGF
jgi:hypothetical protein